MENKNEEFKTKVNYIRQIAIDYLVEQFQKSPKVVKILTWVGLIFAWYFEIIMTLKLVFVWHLAFILRGDFVFGMINLIIAKALNAFVVVALWIVIQMFWRAKKQMKQ